MPDQLAFTFGPAPAPAPGGVGDAGLAGDTNRAGDAPIPHLRDEIARAWSLPLGELVSITFRPAFPIPAITGRLELRASPTRYPWDSHEPLALRVAGQDFTSRDIERWKVI